MAVLRRWTAYAAVTTMTASVLVFAGGSAMADPVGVPSLVDDGAYPGAAQILTEQNVQLIAGDGHVVLADCATPPVGDIGLLKVYTTDETIGADGIGRVCFKVTAAGGWLSLQVPGVYEIRGDGQRTGTGHEVTAELRSDAGENLTVAVDPDGSTQVGLGADPNASPTMLLQLRTGTGLMPVSRTNGAVGKLYVGDRTCTATLIDTRWMAATTLTAETTSGNVCKGDAGGPAITAAGAIVGLFSRGGQSGCLDTQSSSNTVVQVRVDDLVGWITVYTTQMERVTVRNGFNGKCLETNNNAGGNGTRVQQWGCGGQAAALWDVEYIGTRGAEPVYHLRHHEHPTKCVEMPDGSLADGAQAQLWECGDQPAAKWIWRSVGGGRYNLVNINSGKCLEIPDYSLTNGAIAQQWECVGRPSATWYKL